VLGIRIASTEPMKQLIAPFLALVVTFSGVSHAQQGRLKVATVDMEELFKAYNRTTEAKAKMDEDVARVKKDQEERMKRLQEVSDAAKDLGKQLEDPTIADTKKRELFSARQVKVQEAQGLQTELEEFLQRKSRAFQEQNNIIMKGILEEIRAKVQKHAEAEGYDYVVDKTGKSTSMVPILLYTKDATDITDVLLTTINEGVPAPAGEKKEEGK
jgi:outer membrane protein